jgi:membrane protease YdiL (CAAX protease family)
LKADIVRQRGEEMARDKQAILGQHQMDDKNFPSLLAGFLWLLAFIAAQLIISTIPVLIAVSQAGKMSQMMAGPAAFMVNNAPLIAAPTFVGVALSNLVIILGILWYLRRRDANDKVGMHRWSNLSLPITIGVTIAVIGAGLVFNQLYTTYLFPDMELQADTTRLIGAMPDTIGSKILLFVTIAILAPIGEEMVFRGMLQKSFANVFPPYVAIVIAGLIFAAIHMQPYAFLPLFVLGAGFGFLYYITGSLRICIIMHILNNSAAFAQGLYMGS